MKIIRGIHNIKKNNCNSVITIGNFDGIHLGHQKVLNYTCNISKKYNLPNILILFEPQPPEFFKKNKFFSRLMNLRTKIKYISYFKINKILCINFNSHFSNLSPKDFITNILINKLHAKFIIIGDDFRFGNQRNGDIKLLKDIGRKNNFSVIAIKSFHKDNMKISSTRIRTALSEDNIKLTKKLLNRPFSIYGKVIHGDKIGRTLKYPTANIPISTNLSLKNGVYAIIMKDDKQKKYIGIANIGIKSNNAQKKRLLEVHVFDQNIDLYGKKIEVFIYKKIRDEISFNSLEKLKNQITQDVEIVKNYFKNNLLK